MISAESLLNSLLKKRKLLVSAIKTIQAGEVITVNNNQLLIVNISHNAKVVIPYCELPEAQERLRKMDILINELFDEVDISELTQIIS